MNKIYYFFNGQTKKCYFFSDLKCANFYRYIMEEDNPVDDLQINLNNFEGSDIFTLFSFKEKLKEDLIWYYNSYKLKNIHRFILELENRIREEKLDTLLNE